jgi:hypothetical protein
MVSEREEISLPAEVPLPGTMTIDDEDYVYLPERSRGLFRTEEDVDMSLYSRGTGMTQKDFRRTLTQFSSGTEVHRLRESIAMSRRVVRESEDFFARTQAEFVGARMAEIAPRSGTLPPARTEARRLAPPRRVDPVRDAVVERARLDVSDMAFVDPRAMFAGGRELGQGSRGGTSMADEHRAALERMRRMLG